MDDADRASSPREALPISGELDEIAGRLAPIPKQLAQAAIGMIHFFI
jgi:hypothetical protein